MIDFRYHLVSIVSVFLALAVGIVLGAGPLQGQIGDTLTAEINQLRADKTALRDQVSTLEKAADQRNSYIDDSLDRVVLGLASGRGVALVVLPGVESDAVTSMSDLVESAGGTIASTTEVLERWVDPDGAATRDRNDLATRLAPGLHVKVGEGTEPTDLPDQVLAAALTAGTTVGVGQDAVRAALTDLAEAKLIEVTPEEAGAAQLVIVLGGEVSSSDSKARDAAAAAWVTLARALDAVAAGTVVADFAPTPLSKDTTNVVRAIREDTAAARAISTVDNPRQAIGRASVMLALTEQEDGGVGHYGTGDKAQAAHAPMPGNP